MNSRYSVRTYGLFQVQFSAANICSNGLRYGVCHRSKQGKTIGFSARRRGGWRILGHENEKTDPGFHHSDNSAADRSAGCHYPTVRHYRAVSFTLLVLFRQTFHLAFFGAGFTHYGKSCCNRRIDCVCTGVSADAGQTAEKQNSTCHIRFSD